MYIMKNTFFLIVGVFLFSHNVFSQNTHKEGSPYIQNYDNEDYNTPENQTWSILQDKSGVMYFGNNNGLLEFDGNNWKLIETPTKSIVRSLVMDDRTGRIYVGAAGDFGYLQTDSIGIMQYISLLDKVPEEYKDFEDVRKIVVLDKQIIFVSYAYAFILENNKIKTLAPDNRFHFGFGVNNKFYIRELGKGLFTLENNSLKFIEQSEQFANDRIYVMLPYEDDKILMITGNQGVFIYSPNSETNKFVKLSSFREIDEFNNKNQIYYGVKLSEEQLVFGSFQDGIIIINKKGTIIRRINKKSGLQGPMAFSLYVDSKKNIWAGLNNGISYILLNSPFSLYNKNNRLYGNTYTAKAYKDRVYVGTSQGLYYKNQQNTFTMLENTKGPSWHLIELQDQLLLGHFEGVYTSKDSFEKNIFHNTETVWALSKMQNDTTILAGTSNGLRLLEYYNGNWRLKHSIKGFKEYSRHIQTDSENIIWVSHQNKGVFKLKLNESFDSVVELNFFDSSHGLPSNINNYVFKIKTDNTNSQILFGTEKGIYEYNMQTNKFESNKKFNKLLVGRGFIDQFDQDEEGNIFYQQGAEKGILHYQKDGTYKPERIPFLKFKDQYVEHISFVSSNTTLFCTNKGIIQYNHKIKPDYDVSYQVIIGQVFANDSLIFNGTQKVIKNVKLPYKYNNIQFAFSALYYEDHDKTKYSYYLEGSSDKWSEWSVKTEKEYTHLPEGNYIFKVKAKNIYEKESIVAKYEFEISAPWYRTYWAYSGYFIMIGLFVFALIRLNSQRLIKEKKKLETKVLEATEEVKTRNAKLREAKSQLSNIMDDVKNQLGKASEELLDATNSQATSVEEISASIDQMAVVINENAKGASEIFGNVKSIEKEANLSVEIVSKTGSSILDISEEIEFISEFARMTNLLSLNAAIEAARAGTHGRSFAVVANQVKKLADQSKEVAVNIQKISESGLNLSLKANEKIKELQEYIKSIVVLIAKISEASQGQSLEADNINSAIQKISINVSNTTQLAEKLDAAINSLSVDS